MLKIMMMRTRLIFPLIWEFSIKLLMMPKDFVKTPLPLPLIVCFTKVYYLIQASVIISNYIII